MHLMESRLSEDRRLDLMAEAADPRPARRHRARARHGRRRVGQWIVAIGTRVEGPPAPCPAAPIGG